MSYWVKKVDSCKTTNCMQTRRFIFNVIHHLFTFVISWLHENCNPVASTFQQIITTVPWLKNLYSTRWAITFTVEFLKLLLSHKKKKAMLKFLVSEKKAMLKFLVSAWWHFKKTSEVIFFVQACKETWDEFKKNIYLHVVVYL